MIVIVWRYEVLEEHRRQFETFYGALGDWAKLFRRSEEFKGTVLLKGENETYLTLDYWRSREAFDSFLSRHGADYRALDAQSEAWSRSEARIGIFEYEDHSAST
jgi:heme-degrading monooxygenase HmoA